MELDERGRQLGEVSRQLCEVGSVGRASAARLYAAGNAATAGIGTGIEKVSRPRPAARIADRSRRPDRRPLTARRSPASRRRTAREDAIARSFRPTSPTVRDSSRIRPRLDNRRGAAAPAEAGSARAGGQHVGNRPGAQHVGSTTGRERGADLDRQHHGAGNASRVTGRERGATGRELTGSAARRQHDRQHHGQHVGNRPGAQHVGSTTGPATLPE